MWSWTSSSRRTSCSRWWRGCALRRTATSPSCLTPRRPSPPPRNASPKLTPRSTLAGNFGSCENTGPSPSPLPMHRIYAAVCSFIFFFWVIHRLPFYHIYSAFCRPGNHWILNPISEMTGCVMGHKCGFHGKFKMSCQLISSKQGVKLHQGNIVGDQKCEKTSLISVYLHIFF